MIGRESPGSPWPTDAQELLLTSALGTAAEATAAWRAWSARMDLVRDPIDQGSLRLLPLAYRNLSRSGYEDPLMPRLKGVYRYWWLHNQAIFSAASEVLRLLSDRGVETMVLKGLALTELYYRDRGVRPMSDVDIMVPWDRAAEAASILVDSGWAETLGRHPRRFRFRHAIQLVHPRWAPCDLHWNLVRSGVRADEVWWRQSVPVEIGGASTRALDPTGSLFHCVAHGVPWNPVPPLRWIADAVTVLSADGAAVDWDLVESMSLRSSLVLRMTRGLEYLLQRHGDLVPAEVVARLGSSRVGVSERLMESLVMTGTGSRRRLRRLVAGSLQLVADRGVLRAAVEFPDLLGATVGVSRNRRVPAALLRISARKLHGVAERARGTGQA